eukprot:CAMPEP_0176431974 /NCGR_PEP_ID=MMETSP0127-20121128/15118_1 /TAXON_ID=938130 /ORGANISM="Platyophrya macrostoma, Strain WH" /LENGTH=254 /DNA_ID=CAMNT_0017814057 /DNA_START=33 /DNA_END=797 /DNA_ORIENTATION=-
MGKKVLVVFSHPEQKSFCGGMRDAIVKGLVEAGHEVKQSDLYKMKYNPVVSQTSVKELGNKEYFNVIMEYKNAAAKGLFADEYAAEHEKLKWCDYFILISPYWWGSVNAMMKGWVDLTLTAGVAWDFGKIYDKGLLRGKTGMIVTSTSMPENAYAKDGAMGMTLEDRFHHLTWGSLKFCGADVLPTYCAYGVLSASDDARKDMIANVVKRVKEMETAKRLYAYEHADHGKTEAKNEVKLESTSSSKKGGCCYLF